MVNAPGNEVKRQIRVSQNEKMMMSREEAKERS